MSNIKLTGQVSKKFRQSLNTRHENYLNMLNVKLTTYQKGMYLAGVKLLSNFKLTVTSLHHDEKVFKPGLKENV